MALFMGHWRESHLSAFTIYCDASGSANTDVLTMAGFVATAEQWIRLEKRWGEILKRYGVSSLHMKEFAHSTGEFSSWKGDEVRRRNFLSELISELQPRMRHSFSSSVYMADYRSVDEEFGLREVVSPLALVGCSVIAKLFRWADTAKVPHRNLAFFFEDGDLDKGDFIDRSRSIYKMSPIPQLKEESFAFQTADLLAYENNQAVRQVRSKLGGLYFDQLRVPLKRLSQIPCGYDKEDWGVHENPKLKEIYKQILRKSGVAEDAFVRYRNENPSRRRKREVQRRNENSAKSKSENSSSSHGARETGTGSGAQS